MNQFYRYNYVKPLQGLKFLVIANPGWRFAYLGLVDATPSE